jgi:Flp pilus assembly protein TadD, contains TPR repeats
MRYTLFFTLLLLFSSCSSSAAGYGVIGVIGLFALMFILFAVMFFLIAKRKKQGEKSLVKFNNDVYLALNKLNTPQQKVNMLNSLIGRINNDKKYAKDTEWRNKVLLKTYLHLATACYQMGDEMQTLDTCTKIIELDDNDGMAYYNRGSIYSNIGLYEKALSDLNKTIELLPNYASAYNNRGLVHEKMEHYNEAINDFTQAIHLEESPVAYYNRGNTNYELHKYSDALSDYREAIRRLDADAQSELKSEIEISINIIEDKLED